MNGATDLRREPFGPKSLMSLLYENAKSNLTQEELDWIAFEGPRHAEDVADAAAALAQRLAALIAADGASPSPSGCFQSHHDIPRLLSHFSTVFEQLGALAEMSSDASFQLLRACDESKGVQR
jgi:hypothetical protein